MILLLAGKSKRSGRPSSSVTMHRINSLIGSRLSLSPVKRTGFIPAKPLVVFEGKESKAMADQLATVSKERLFRYAGVISQEDMHKIEEAIKIQLDIH